MKNLPNIFSIFRIILAIILLPIYLLNTKTGYIISIGIITVAAISDYLDGRLARAFDVASLKGYIIDGLGDRAIHISLVLIFYANFNVNILIVWLLIFREVTIYALRILADDWNKIKELRRLSLLYVYFLRFWFLNYLIIDSMNLFYANDLYQYFFIVLLQYTLIIIAICIGYLSLYKYVKIVF